MTDLICTAFLLMNSACMEYRPPPDWTELILAAGFEEKQIETVLCLIYKESNFDPLAIGHNGKYPPDIGLMQINESWAVGFDKPKGGKYPPLFPNWDREFLLDPFNNLKAAKAIYERNGNFNMWHTASFCID